MVEISRKKIPFGERGDKIEVRLMDSSFQIYYKKRTSVRKLKDIIDDLKDYGISLTVRKSPKGRSWWD